MNETITEHPVLFSFNKSSISYDLEENNCYGTKMVDKCKAVGGECITLSNGEVLTLVLFE